MDPANIYEARHQLNVEAAAKGLVRGNLIITCRDGSIFDCRMKNVLIENVDDYSSVEIGLCDTILVIEKEAVYHTLLACWFNKSHEFNCIMVTGKGCENKGLFCSASLIMIGQTLIFIRGDFCAIWRNT